MLPRISRVSYDGSEHYQHKQAQLSEIDEALLQLVKEDQDEAAVTEDAPEAKPQPPLSFHAKVYDEKKVIAAMQQAPPKHEFTGYVFSSETPRKF
ncbi:hypothetical protein PoB_003181400 [Plakobranchus ocellatus]|uniref:Uncharacterized protein n=1 Tax=Plakobranchus ocellatus TaxID=259542 RepID=A0AAV4AGD5_9GAST|nr:hypothetical protein PoB_003181400 [Plakobranchus ocellatus]